MPRPRSTDLIGREHDPVFYEPGVQRILDRHFPYVKSKLVQQGMGFKSAHDRDLAFAKPLLFFQIACKNAIRTKRSRTASSDPRIREMFWEAYELCPELMADLLKYVTEYRSQPPSDWEQERQLAELLFFWDSNPNNKELGWDPIAKLISKMYGGSPSQCSKILNDINSNRSSRLEEWSESIAAYERTKENGFGALLPRSMGSSWELLQTQRFHHPGNLRELWRHYLDDKNSGRA